MVGPTDADALEKRREIVRVVGHVGLVRAGFGKAMAPLVIEDDAEVRRKDPGDFGPDAEVGPEGIDEDERRRVARPKVEIMDDEAVGRDEFHGAGFSVRPRRVSRKTVHS